MHHFEIVVNKNFNDIDPVQFGYEDCEPSHYYGPAVRTYWLLHFVFSGFGSFEREGKTYSVGPGDIFVIPPMLETYYEADSEKPWRYSWIGFNADSRLVSCLSKPVISCPEAAQIFERMRLCKDFDEGRTAYLTGCIWNLLALISEQTKPKTDYVSIALSCIHSEYMNGIKVSDIAKRLSLDRSYFSCLFKEKIGVSPASYIRNYRLSKAAELMTVYGEKPSLAATSVGFDDIFHFSKCFKQHYGVSPRKYMSAYELTK